jgi:hypothetical protein
VLTQSTQIQPFLSYQNVPWFQQVEVPGGGGGGPENPLISSEGTLVTGDGDTLIYEE